MKTINTHIKTKDFMPFYLIYGEEGKTRAEVCQRLKNAVTEDEGEYNYYEGEPDPYELINTANTLSFFSGKRFIYVKDSGIFTNARCEKLIEYFKNPNPQCVMAFNEKKIDKRNKIYKALVKNGGYTLECKKPTLGEIKKYYLSVAKANNVTINADALDALAANTEADFSAASCEFEKLYAYTLGKNKITLDDVNNISSKKLESRIFDLIDAICCKKTAKALDIFSNMLLLKESDVAILISIARQFRLILQYKYLSKQMPAEEIAKRTGAHPFTIKKAAMQAHNFTNRRLLDALADCKNMLENAFSGSLNLPQGIEMLIIKYTA